MARLKKFSSASNRASRKTTAESASTSATKWRMVLLLGVSFLTLLFYCFVVVPSLGLTELNPTTTSTTMTMTKTTKTKMTLMRNPASSAEPLISLNSNGEQPLVVLEKELLPINMNSTISSEIKHIVHDPNESKIEVHLLNDINLSEGKGKERRCKFPIFKGRISGVSLSMIQWEKEMESSTTLTSNNTIEDSSLLTMANSTTTTTTTSNIIVG